MDTKPEDLKNIEVALRKYLFESPDPEENLAVLLQNPQLLTNFVDNLFDSLIESARQEEDEPLIKLYQGRRMLLQAVRNSLSKKDVALLHLIKQLKRNILTKTPSSGKPFEFQEILDKVQIWLKAPTREKGIKVLQEYPELLTDQPERMFSVLIENARQQGNDFFVRVLRTLSQIFRVIRLELGEKSGATASIDELKQAVAQALDHADFSVFVEGKQPAVFIA